MVEKAWREFEAAGHMDLQPGSREVACRSVCLPFSIQSWTLMHGMEKSKFRVNLLTSVNSIFKIHSHGQSRVSKVILNPV